MATGKNEVSYHTNRRNFYKYLKKPKSAKFEEYLMQFAEDFNYTETQRSKRLFYKTDDRAIWYIRLPNPGREGKNAFRMLCMVDKRNKKFQLAYLFSRKDLYSKEYKKKFDNCIKELKNEYF